MPKTTVETFTFHFDDDGDFNGDLTCKVDNDGKATLDLVVTSAILLNGNDCALAGSFGDVEETCLEEGDSESMTVSVGGWGLKEGQMGSNKAVKATVGFDYYERGAPVTLIEAPVPKDHETVSEIKTVDAPGDGCAVTGATVTRTEPDDDNDVTVSAKIGIQNTSKTDMLKFDLKTTVFDKKKNEVGGDTDTVDLIPGEKRILEPSMYVKKGKANGATLKLQLNRYELLGREAIEANASEGSAD